MRRDEARAKKGSGVVSGTTTTPGNTLTLARAVLALTQMFSAAIVDLEKSFQESIGSLGPRRSPEAPIESPDPFFARVSSLLTHCGRLGDPSPDKLF